MGVWLKVKPDAEDEMTKGGIALPRGMGPERRPVVLGELLEIGEGVEIKDVQKGSPNIQVGDRVAFDAGAPFLKVPGFPDVVLYRANDLVAVVDFPPVISEIGGTRWPGSVA